ncbi:Fur family transcriptional regulator [Ancylobacter amanitiformis]|uniref:Fur family zinc uptake transcriptional regulator n=1 Tax=Ancylobacter amanitiformis TaxID=217069 RepID=A0ABU0LPA7_9HYPH|nr:transcriptional repressor [Ancylobacter amanitiformis]MDQ0510433.1 Fur family zinc uptake transcriptional regulator [Ancylobacter amanitiformis]
MTPSRAPPRPPPSGHDSHHDHDHGACVAVALARAEASCGERGARLTPLRRRVLEGLADSHVPLGAYELVERLGSTGDKPPPMSVYRALDFLVAEGLAHRIESRNAYIACGSTHGADDVIVFLICESCGLTSEVASHAIGRDLAWAARAAGFAPRASVIEIPGTCARCRATAAAAIEPPAGEQASEPAPESAR